MLLVLILYSIIISIQAECYSPVKVLNSPPCTSFGKLIPGSIRMEKDVERIRGMAEACNLSGQELIDFIREERMVREKHDRDERAFQLELRRNDREMLEMQIRLETLKHESMITHETAANTSSQTPTPRIKAKAPKLPPFDELKDDLDAYIQRFERYAISQDWERDEWAINLSAFLKGKALDVYSRLAVEDATKYDSLKDALLKRFHLTAIGFRQKFREIRAEKGETAPQFVARLDCTLTRWIEMDKTIKTYDGLKDLILREQFLIIIIIIIKICSAHISTLLGDQGAETEKT